ncbi:MAG: methyl-accepting chemotaxis protein [Desulfobacterales bacterium]
MKKMSLTSKILASNCVPLILIVILSFIASFSIKTLLKNNYWVDHTHEVINKGLAIQKLLVDMETGIRGFLITGKDNFLEPYTTGKESITEIIEHLKNQVSDNSEQMKRLTNIEENIKSWIKKIALNGINKRKKVTAGTKKMEDVIFMVESGTGKQIMDDLRIKINEFIDIEHRLMNIRNENSEKSGNNAINVLIFGTLFTIIITLFIGYFISKSIAKPVNTSIESLIGSSEALSSSSTQSASSSQQLAEKTSEQAASLEEVVSSLEEISSMTRQNEENVKQTDNIMRNVDQIVKKADESMNSLINAMSGISNASEEIRKIINTIDEIAFQTNLLALNAAVEAARAGESGAGFAVVADEVKNLAMRATSEAKNTAVLIEDTIQKVDTGSEYVNDASASFSEVVKKVVNAVNLLAEISSASSEQKRGIEQVSRSVSEMDTIVQQNAANAEESASVSEEINSQSEKMKEVIQELVLLVKGKINAT